MPGVPGMPPLVLASSSEHRAALLARLGLPFDTRAPEVDEGATRERFETLGSAAYTIELAHLKAQAVLRNPFGRLTTPRDVANVISLLSTDEAAWINGCVIRVDGGEHISGATR